MITLNLIREYDFMAKVVLFEIKSNGSSKNSMTIIEECLLTLEY